VVIGVLAADGAAPTSPVREAAYRNRADERIEAMDEDA
jgi:hypothetical protein